jgi:hypothetical protein
MAKTRKERELERELEFQRELQECSMRIMEERDGREIEQAIKELGFVTHMSPFGIIGVDIVDDEKGIIRPLATVNFYSDSADYKYSIFNHNFDDFYYNTKEEILNDLGHALTDNLKNIQMDYVHREAIAENAVLHNEVKISKSNSEKLMFFLTRLKNFDHVVVGKKLTRGGKYSVTITAENSTYINGTYTFVLTTYKYEERADKLCDDVKEILKRIK